MDWKLKSMNDATDIVDFEEGLTPVLVGYEGEEEKIVYAVVEDKIIRSSEEGEKDFSVDEFKQSSSEIPDEIKNKFLASLDVKNTEDNTLDNKTNVSNTDENNLKNEIRRF